MFRPLTDNATRLPNVDGGAWDGNRAISGGEEVRLLKRYARLAEPDGWRIHAHVLRHSDAPIIMLTARVEEADPAQPRHILTVFGTGYRSSPG